MSQIIPIFSECKKECTITNYIPHRSPINCDYYKWYNAYIEYLQKMFVIFISVSNKRYPKDKIKDKLNLFDNFCLNSMFKVAISFSKYISKYI